METSAQGSILPPIDVLVVGRLQELPVGLEFPDDATSRQVETAQDALNALDALHAAPAVIVLAQSRPGQFSGEAIDALRRAAPLARFHRVLGSWCEGEQRSGRPPAGCTSGYWHRWQLSADQHLSANRPHASIDWSLPPTATADERLLASVDPADRKGSGVVVICAETSATAAALADVCRLAGYSPWIVRDRQTWTAVGAVAIVWDTTADRATDGRCVQSLRGSAGDAPLLAVIGFPRHDDCQKAREAGVAAVISKPFLVRDLLRQLARATARTS